MERREFIALLGVATAMMPSASGAQASPLADSSDSKHPADSLAGRIVGTWSFAASVNTRKDGSTFDRWGANPKGLFMFDRGGHYSQIIVGSESRVFGAKTFCSFGAYSIDEANKVLVTQIEGCSVSKISGTTQLRTILWLTAEEFKYTNPITTNGSTADVLWKRLT